MGPTEEHNDGGGIKLIFILNSPHPTLLFGRLSRTGKDRSAATYLINPPTSLAFEKATVNWARQIPSASSPGTTGATSQWTRGDMNPPCGHGLSSGLVRRSCTPAAVEQLLDWKIRRTRACHVSNVS